MKSFLSVDFFFAGKSNPLTINDLLIGQIMNDFLKYLLFYLISDNCFAFVIQSEAECSCGRIHESACTGQVPGWPWPWPGATGTAAYYDDREL